jgi:hypothetical protein
VFPPSEAKGETNERVIWYRRRIRPCFQRFDRPCSCVESVVRSEFARIGHRSARIVLARS